MKLTALVALASLSSLSACAGTASHLAWPTQQLSQLELPELNLSRMALPGGRSKQRLTATRPHTLSQAEEDAVHTVVGNAFTTPETVQIFTVKAGQTVAGDLAVCGAVNARRSDGSATEARLFRVEGQRAADGSLGFVLKQVAGANASTIEVFSDCRDLGLAGGPRPGGYSSVADNRLDTPPPDRPMSGPPGPSPDGPR
ncbi:hypothetical protein [Consotaella aegiceratis]|uniref:hypothetical protein n=1 Tax=Consotaella aegiceratis TaxID=3097961 RepID=UPI002F41C20A